MKPIPLIRTPGDGLYAGDVSVQACDAEGRLGWRVMYQLVEVCGFKLGYAEGRVRIRQCCVCAAYFLGDLLAKWCSDSCRESRKAEQRKESLAKRAEKRKRRRKQQCIICHVPIAAARSTRHYCSARCRQRAKRRGWAEPRKKEVSQV